MRHRLNKKNNDASFFDATDWLYLAYRKDNWELSAGKQVVAIGGYEYDAAPIDLYFCSGGGTIYLAIAGVVQWPMC